MFTAGNFFKYSYDDIGQLKTATGWKADGTMPRLQEKLGYAYDAAWNLSRRTNNALIETFAVDNRNQLSSASRSGTFAVAGATGQRRQQLHGGGQRLVAAHSAGQRQLQPAGGSQLHLLRQRESHQRRHARLRIRL